LDLVTNWRGNSPEKKPKSNNEKKKRGGRGERFWDRGGGKTGGGAEGEGYLGKKELYEGK